MDRGFYVGIYDKPVVEKRMPLFRFSSSESDQVVTYRLVPVVKAIDLASGVD